MKYQLLIFMLSIKLLHAFDGGRETEYTIPRLAVIASKNDALKIAALAEDKDFKDVQKRSLSKKLDFPESEFAARIQQARAKLGGGAAGAKQELSQEQFEQLKKDLKVTLVPNITTKDEAKEELVKFFEIGTGKSTLDGIYGINGPQKAIVDALKKAPAAA